MTSNCNGPASADCLSDSPDSPSAPQLLVSLYDDACLARGLDPSDPAIMIKLWKPLLAMHRAGVRDEAVLRALVEGRNLNVRRRVPTRGVL